MSPDLIKQYLLTAVRWGLGMFAGSIIAWVSSQTGLDVSTTTSAVASVLVGGLMFLWALINKTKSEAKINTALDLEKGASKDTLKAVIAAGQGTSATAVK